MLIDTILCGRWRTKKWVCFDCRTSFGESYMTNTEAKKHFKKDWPEREQRCTTCGDELVCMGYYFRAPRKQDKRRWKHIKQHTQRHRMNGYIWGFLDLPPRRPKKSVRRAKERDEAFQKRMKNHWKTCHFCGTFFKKGLHEKHTSVCATQYYEKADSVLPTLTTPPAD